MGSTIVVEMRAATLAPLLFLVGVGAAGRRGGVLTGSLDLSSWSGSSNAAGNDEEDDTADLGEFSSRVMGNPAQHGQSTGAVHELGSGLEASVTNANEQTFTGRRRRSILNAADQAKQAARDATRCVTLRAACKQAKEEAAKRSQHLAVNTTAL